MGLLDLSWNHSHVQLNIYCIHLYYDSYLPKMKVTPAKDMHKILFFITVQTFTTMTPVFLDSIHGGKAQLFF